MKKFVIHIIVALLFLAVIAVLYAVINKTGGPGIYVVHDSCVQRSAPDSLTGLWHVVAFDTLLLTKDTITCPTITFTDDAVVTATAGCNGMGGRYEYSDGQLIIVDGMCQTEMWCDNELIMRNERLLSYTLHDTLAVYALQPDTIMVKGVHLLKMVK